MKRILWLSTIFLFHVATASAEVSALTTLKIEKDLYDIAFEVGSTQNNLLIKKNGALQQTIKIPLTVETPSQIIIKDFNFDGLNDIGIPGDQGNVERYMDIYLFSKTTGKFEHSKNLSQIPCLSVNFQHKNISGTCFHSSACENWEEVYTLSTPDVLNLLEKRGYYCDPSTNKTYKYLEKYRHGKLTKKIVQEFNQ